VAFRTQGAFHQRVPHPTCLLLAQPAGQLEPPPIPWLSHLGPASDTHSHSNPRDKTSHRRALDPIAEPVIHRSFTGHMPLVNFCN
jgi:hypothetical protein